MEFPRHYLFISPPLNKEEKEMLQRQDSWTISKEGDRLSYDSMVDSVGDAIEWLEIFIERLTWNPLWDSSSGPPAHLKDKGFTFDHTLSGIMWLRGHEEDAALIVEENKIKKIRFPEPLNGFDWPAILRSYAWLIEQDEEVVKPLIGLVDTLIAHLRESGVPDYLLDPSDYSSQ
jgi:hypothetical protein